jgi:hypothetical protein
MGYRAWDDYDYRREQRRDEEADEPELSPDAEVLCEPEQLGIPTVARGQTDLPEGY